MTAVFSQILNMSLTGSVVILFVMAARLLLRRFPKIFSYVLWSVVLFRLLCPVAFSAPVSLLGALQPQVRETARTVTVVEFLPEAAPAEPETAGNETPSQPVLQVKEEPHPKWDGMEIAACIWLLGIAAMGIHSAVQYFRLRSKLVGAAPYRQNAYLADHINMPFVLGILKPRIYIPSGIPPQERRYILAHERHHIRRFDHVTKMLAYGALCLHWFNPLVWAAFVLAGRDMEMSCDEAVIKKLGEDIRADYSASLLRLATHKPTIGGTPLAFGEGDTKGRVRNMARWRKPKAWISVLCLILCIGILIVCAVNPFDEKKSSDTNISFGEFQFALPESFQGKNTPQGYQITRDGTIVGGVCQLDYPEQKIGDLWTWVEQLNIPENVPEDRFMMSVSPMQSEVFTYAVSYGKQGVEETVHYLYEGNQYVYDLWLDIGILHETEKVDILNAVNGAAGYAGQQPYDLSDPVKMLPDGFRLRKNDVHDVVFLNGDTTVGGIKVKQIPEKYSQQDYFTDEFFLSIGVAEAGDASLGQSGGGSTVDWCVEYFSDVPGPAERTVHSYHQFYVTGDGYIFDIWFDMLQIDSAARDQILSYILIPEINQIRDGTAAYMETAPKETSIVELGSGSRTATKLKQDEDLSLGQFNITIPKGYGYHRDETTILEITREGGFGEQVVAASVTARPNPNLPMETEPDLIRWAEALGIDLGSEGIFSEIADQPEYGDVFLAIHNNSGIPPMEEEHYLYISGNIVYDVWLDPSNIDSDDKTQLLESIWIKDTTAVLANSIPEAAEQEFLPTGNGAVAAIGGDTVRICALNATLPSGLGASEENGRIVLKNDANTVGGIALRKQKEINDPKAFSSDWMKEIGVPEASDDTMGYMGGSSLYGDYEMTYFPDMPVNRANNGNIIPDEQGTYVLEQEVTHYFFVNGTDVYDIWFYINRLPNVMRETMLKSCYIQGVTDISAMESALAEENKALEQCKAVLSHIQSTGACKIETKQENGPFALNETSLITNWLHGENRLHICMIPESGGSSMFGGLLVDGEKYEWDAAGQWREIADWKIPDPWLASFQWEDSAVAYMDTLEETEETTVMLRIDQPFAQGEDQQPHYFVNFRYAPDGAFRSVYIQTNLFADNAIAKTETVVSLDEESIAGEIREEYEKTISGE